MSTPLAARTVTVTALIKDENQVVLASDQAELSSPNTFVLQAGETVIFKLVATPGPLRGVARIHFKRHPPEAVGDQPLLRRDDGTASDILEARDGVVKGTIRSEALDGDYAYDVELDGNRLNCFWGQNASAPPSKIGMGGGKKGAGP